MLRCWLLVCLAACGRLRFDPQATQAVDASGDTTADSGFGAFGTPVKVTELESMENDIVPSLRADQLEVVFSSLRPPNTGSHILWDATRLATDQPFSNLQQLTFAGAVGTSEAALSDDGLQLYLLRNGGALCFTDRATVTSPWNALTVASELANMTGADYIGDLRMVMSGTVDRNIFESTRADRHAAWSTPKRLDELVVAGVRSEYPTASADGLEIFYSVDDGTSLQLVHAVRPALDQPFGPTIPIDVGFATVRVGDPELTHDGHTLYFVAQNGPTGDFEIYVMTR